MDCNWELEKDGRSGPILLTCYDNTATIRFQLNVSFFKNHYSRFNINKHRSLTKIFNTDAKIKTLQLKGLFYNFS